MKIERFFAQSLGEWSSMRSGHSLAFQHFEEIRSRISISPANIKDPEVKEMINLNNNAFNGKLLSPFKINWESESDWESELSIGFSKGSNILVPICESETNGIILMSQGYSEKIPAKSSFKLLSDGTLNLETIYENTIAEEKIWFVSNNLRCRASVIKNAQTSAILQTSFASEVKQLIIN